MKARRDSHAEGAGRRFGQGQGPFAAVAGQGVFEEEDEEEESR